MSVVQNNSIKEEDIIRVNIHKNLLKEFQLRKEEYEKKVGYKINGGTPVISLICAEILKKDRENKKDRIVIEIRKMKGLKRVETVFL